MPDPDRESAAPGMPPLPPESGQGAPSSSAGSWAPPLPPEQPGVMPPLPPGGNSLPVGWHGDSWSPQEGAWLFDGPTSWHHQDLRGYSCMPPYMQQSYPTPSYLQQQQQQQQHGGSAIQQPHPSPPQQHVHQLSQQPPHPQHQQLPQHFAPLIPSPIAGLPRMPQGGVIFLCDPRTEAECLQRGLFGLPATQTAIVRAIVPETTLLFLFNVRTRHVLGLFRATTWPQQNLEPHAFGEDAGGGSRFPLQVRVRLDGATVLALSEERARPALEYHGTHNRFELQMGEGAAARLAQLLHQCGDPRATPLSGMSHAIQPSSVVLGVATSRRPTLPEAADTMGGAETVGVGADERWKTPRVGACGGSPHPHGSGERQHSGERHGSGGERHGSGGDRSHRNGMVFICDPTTEDECLSRRLLGLPKSQASLLSKLSGSSLLFLFNVRTRKLLGVFQPDGAAGLELEPSAFGGDGRFPVQVRFVPVHPTTLRPTNAVLSIPERAVDDVLRYRNAKTRFDLLLRGRAVERILAVFSDLGRAVPMPPPLPPTTTTLAGAAAAADVHVPDAVAAHHGAFQTAELRVSVAADAPSPSPGTAPPTCDVIQATLSALSLGGTGAPEALPQ